MDHTTQHLSRLGIEAFQIAKRCLLPNEEIRSAGRIKKGFLVLSDRRLILLKEEKELEFSLERVIPYDCVLNLVQEKDERYKISGITLDQFGCYNVDDTDEINYQIKEFDISAHKAEKGENKNEVNEHFHSSMKQITDDLEILQRTYGDTRELPLVRDYSYLDKLPESLTRNAILDLNNVLQDMPIHDRLYHEASKFLGNGAFLLEESLRDGNNIDNGFLFAAGKQGYIWIQGKKNGRHIANVLVDKIEWDNIKCAIQRWQGKDSKFDVVYTLQAKGRELTHHYKWSLTANQDVLEHPWLMQQLNGPWILADIMYKYSGRPLPASWISEKHLQQQELQKQRYYL